MAPGPRPAIEAIQRVLDWAEQRSISVLLDLHGGVLHQPCDKLYVRLQGRDGVREAAHCTGLHQQVLRHGLTLLAHVSGGQIAADLAEHAPGLGADLRGWRAHQFDAAANKDRWCRKLLGSAFSDAHEHGGLHNG